MLPLFFYTLCPFATSLSKKLKHGFKQLIVTWMVILRTTNSNSRIYYFSYPYMIPYAVAFIWRNAIRAGMSVKFNFQFSRLWKTNSLNEDQCSFFIVSHSVLPRIITFQWKFIENIIPQFLFTIFLRLSYILIK